MTVDDPDVDADALAADLSDWLGERVTGFEVLGDGVNLVLGVSTAGAGPGYVLRRPNAGRRTPSFVGVEREYRLLERLRDTDVPAPEPVAVRGDHPAAGGPVVVTTRVAGEPFPWRSALPERFRTPAARERIGTLLADALAGIHALDPDRFADVCDRHAPRDQVARAVDRLDEVAPTAPTLRAVGDRLRDRAPSTGRTALLHGDFRPGNVLFVGDDRPNLSAVVDWETALVGDPLTELGYLLLDWRDDGGPAPSLDGLEATYPDADLDGVRDLDENGLSQFAAAPGAPSRRDLAARYEARTGIPFENERFYVAQAAFLLGTVWADLHHSRAEARGESDPDPEPAAEYMGMVAEATLDGERPL